MDRPAGNGSRADWAAYAEQIGVSADGTRDEIAARVTEHEAASQVVESDQQEEAPPNPFAQPDLEEVARRGDDRTMDYTRRAGGYRLTDRGWVLEG